MKNLKRVFVLLIMIGLPLLGRSHTSGEPIINKIIEDALKFEHGVLSLDENKIDFVKISFRINEEGRITVLVLNYSDKEIKDQLMNRLSKIRVEENVDLNKIYNCSFSFKKV